MNSIRQQFKDFSPDKKWKNSLRSELVSLAERELDTQKESYFDAFKSYFAFHHLARAVAVASLVISIVTGGSILTVSAAKDSLPGDTLYSVKRASEKVQDMATYRPEAKVKLKLSFAKERLNEARVIAKTKVSHPDSKAKIDQSMVDFQAEIAQAQKYLDEIKETSGEITEEIKAELAYFNVNGDAVELSTENMDENKLASLNLETASVEGLEEQEIEIDMEDNIEVLDENDENLLEDDKTEAVLEESKDENILAEIDANAKEYKEIFEELKNSKLLADDGIEIDKAVEAVAQLTNEPVVEIEIDESVDENAEEVAETEEAVVKPVVPVKKIQTSIIRELPEEVDLKGNE